MENIKITTVLLTMLCSALFSNLFAQAEVSANFLLISPDARSSAMGEANVAIADNANAVFWNPAGLAFQSGMEFTGSYANWLPEFAEDIWYGFAAYKYSLKDLGTIGFSYYKMDYGSSDSEYSISANYGTTVNKNLAVGLGLKYIHFQYTNSYGYNPGDAFTNSYNKIAVDLGILYKIPRLNELSFGASLANIGPATEISIVNGSIESPLPTRIKFGLAYNPLNLKHNKITLAFDFDKLLVNQSNNREFDPLNKAFFSSWDNGFKDVTYSYGIEYLYANMFVLRTGCLYDDDGKRYLNNWGIGFKYSTFDLDLSVINAEKGHPLDETIRFSFQIKSLESLRSSDMKKSQHDSFNFKKAVSPNISLFSPWVNEKNKRYVPTVSFGASFLYPASQNLLLEFGGLYSPLSVSENYINNFVSNISGVSDISITESSSSLTKFMAGARYLFQDNSMYTGYLSLAVSTYMFGDISAKYSVNKSYLVETFRGKSEIKIEPENKIRFGMQFGPGTIIQSSKNIAFDLKVNFHVLFGQSSSNYWLEPNFAVIYMF